jgi:hypothetical protein
MSNNSDNTKNSAAEDSGSDDLSYLFGDDFGESEEIKELEKKVAQETTPRAAAIITSISDLGLIAAFCVVMDISAIVTPSGVFGSCAFLEHRKPGEPEKQVIHLTKSVKGLDAVLVQYVAGKMKTNLYRDGEIVEELVPTLVLGNLSELAEDAIVGQLDLFQLVEEGNAQVSAVTIDDLPSNYIPKKYQQRPPGFQQDLQNGGQPGGNKQEVKVFSTKQMPKSVALKALEQHRNE